MKAHFKFLIVLISIFLLSSVAHAQAPTSIDGIEIDIFPSTPAPGVSVEVNLESFSTNLSAASMIWSVNGKSAAQGTGLTSYKTSAPALGKTLTISVVIKTVEGREVRKAVAIQSGSVDLIWESEGIVPPFYKSKSLFVYENTMKVTAVPHLANSNGSELDPKTLVYKWKKNDKVIQDQSGYGKQTLTFQEEIPRPVDIVVEISTPTGTQKAQGSMTLTPGDPSILFYEEDPLYGVFYNRAVTQRFGLSNPEITIRAIPYHFNPQTRNSPLSYLWSINNLERKDLSTNESITLRTKSNSVGSSLISLEIRNLENILQGAKGEVSVLFNNKQNP